MMRGNQDQPDESGPVRTQEKSIRGKNKEHNLTRAALTNMASGKKKLHQLNELNISGGFGKGRSLKKTK